jgi:hypothetical protein
VSFVRFSLPTRLSIGRGAPSGKASARRPAGRIANGANAGEGRESGAGPTNGLRAHREMRDPGNLM